MAVDYDKLGELIMTERRYLSQTPEFAAAVERRRADAMTLQQIAENSGRSTAPDSRRHLEHKRGSELHDALLMVLLKPLTIFFAAVAGAHEEHQRMLHAPAVYLGTEK